MIFYNETINEIHITLGCFPMFNEGNGVEWNHVRPTGSIHTIMDADGDWVFIGFL